MDGVLNSGGIAYETVQARCQAGRSYRQDELLVRIDAEEALEPAAYFVDKDLVTFERDPGPGEMVDAAVQVLLLERRNGTVIIEVAGEPLSYGPKIAVSGSSVVHP